MIFGYSGGSQDGINGDNDNQREGEVDGLERNIPPNKLVFRCLLLVLLLLLVLPVAVPVFIYLKDMKATHTIFLAAFVLFLIILILSCMLRSLLRTSKTHLEHNAYNGGIQQPLAHSRIYRYPMDATHHFMPRPIIPLRRHRPCDGLSVIWDTRVIDSYQSTHPHHPASVATTLPLPYNHAVTSNSPITFRLQTPSIVNGTDHSPDHMTLRNDDLPPPYEAIQHSINAPYTNYIPPTPETPPPTYDKAIS